MSAPTPSPTAAPRASADAGGGTVLDPFGLWPSARSAVRGLGGSEPPRTPRYVFASPQAYAGRGTATFRLAFDGLRATSGVLRLRVSAQGERAARSRWVGEESVPLAALAVEGGGRTVSVPSRADTLYALAGQVEGGTDASADGLTLTLSGDAGVGLFTERLRRAARPSPRGLGPPTLERPVSQMCTAAQMEEPAYGRWLARLHAPHAWHRKQWEFVYILQALESRGLLRPGARGLGFGCGADPLASYLASRGCEVLATDLDGADQVAAGWRETGQHADGAEGLHRPELIPRAAFDARVRFRAADMRAIPDDLRGFDFCWSACAFEHLGSIRAGLAFVEASLATLRPGGTAVHTTELNLTSNGETVDSESTVLFRRRDMERLARRLARRGHAVAPLNFDRGDGALDGHVDVAPFKGDPHLRIALKRFVTTSFGLVVVKAGGERPGAHQ